MKDYRTVRKERERTSVVTGLLLTLAIHAGAFVLVSYTGIKYLYPPPAEDTFLLEVEETGVEELLERDIEAMGEDADPEEHLEIVQRSESPDESDGENLTPETRPDTFGDIPTPEPPAKEEPKLDPRASFPGMAKKDTTLTARHGAKESSETFKAGQPGGNTNTGRTDGRPNARLAGRTVEGGLRKPAYTSQESGTVVVDIWVDNYGDVKKAVAGGEGTTVSDKSLWAAARSAAMETHFNQSADAPAMQQGTITYIFNLQ